MPVSVFVGASQAGATAAATLAEGGYDGRIVLIGAERAAPYERPPLSKEYLRGEEPFDEAYLRPDGWYEEHGVEMRLGTRVERLDTAAREVVLEGGERIAFDQAVVATGSRNKRPPIPGIDLDGVLSLRTAADADAIRAAAASGMRAVLVGMGFIGAEVAASLRHLGLGVTVVEFAETPLQRVLGSELGRVLEGLHRDHGVEMVFRDAAERFEGDGRFEALRTKQGRTLEGDFAVVGIGVEPVTDVVDGTDVAVDNGILVDAALRTNVPGVYAVGDVARHDHPVFGPIRVEHYDNALKMGAHVAGVMLGRVEPFDDPHWFWSDQYDADIQMAGFASAWDQIVIRGNMKERNFAAFLLRDGVLLSTFAMNRPREVRRSMPLIKAAARPDPAGLANPAVDLRTLAPKGAAR
jgi:3-phenylpropionate/trans-cinnamate dioxygenase ferredoxin reductase component